MGHPMAKSARGATDRPIEVTPPPSLSPKLHGTSRRQAPSALAYPGEGHEASRRGGTLSA